MIDPTPAPVCTRPAAQDDTRRKEEVALPRSPRRAPPCIHGTRTSEHGGRGVNHPLTTHAVERVGQPQPALEVERRHRAREVVALDLVAAPAAPSSAQVSALSTPSATTRTPSRRPRSIERVHDRGVALVAGDAHDERAVDLEHVDVQLLEVREPGVAGAEVVERRQRRRSRAGRRARRRCARRRPSRCPRRPRSAAASGGKRCGASSRSTSEGSPRSSRSAGPRLTATLSSWPRGAQVADLLERAVEHERGQRAREPALLDEREEVPGRRAARAAGAASARAPRRRAPRPCAARPWAGSAGRARRPRAPSPSSPTSASRWRLWRSRAGRGRPRGRCACAWPRTSRRRRAGAARARPRRAWGRARCRRWRRCARGCRRPRRAPRARRAAAGPAVLADASSPGWRTTANSSPPSRASVSSSRSSACSRGPIWRSTSSPAWWPSVSLSSLKPSRSTSSSASSSPRTRARLDRRVQRVDEVAAVAEAGEVVGHRLLVRLPQALDDGAAGARHARRARWRSRARRRPCRCR